MKQECCGNPFRCKGNCVDFKPELSKNMTPTKEQLIAQGTWDVLKDKPYENRTVQAAQSSNILRSIQSMDDLEKDRGSKGQSQAGRSLEGSGCQGQRCPDAIQMMKEAFCVVEEMVKYMESRGHHLSHAHAKGKLYLEKISPLIS